MTILCIIISVLLVTTIFSVAEMFIRTKSDELQNKHGNYHIQLENISQSIGDEISSRSDVTAIGWSEAKAFPKIPQSWVLQGKAIMIL